MQDAPTSELEARLTELSQERDHFRKLYLEALERCALLERGITAGNKAERLTADGPQLTLGVLGLLLTPETPQEPEAPTASPVGEESSLPPPARRRPTGRRAITTMLPRVEIEVLPPEVQREGLDAFERIGEETSEVIEHRPASLVVVVIVRPKFVRKRAAQADASMDPDVSPVLIAEPPERPIDRGLAGPRSPRRAFIIGLYSHAPTSSASSSTTSSMMPQVVLNPRL